MDHAPSRHPPCQGNLRCISKQDISYITYMKNVYDSKEEYMYLKW